LRRRSWYGNAHVFDHSKSHWDGRPAERVQERISSKHWPHSKKPSLILGKIRVKFSPYHDLAVCSAHCPCILTTTVDKPYPSGAQPGRSPKKKTVMSSHIKGRRREFGYLLWPFVPCVSAAETFACCFRSPFFKATHKNHINKSQRAAQPDNSIHHPRPPEVTPLGCLATFSPLIGLYGFK
jgi:hypothetical protein